MSSLPAFLSVIVSTLWTWTLLGLASFIGYQVSQERDPGNIPGFDLLPNFLRIPLQNQTESAILFTLSGVVIGFLVFFLTSYVWQALQDFFRLEMVSQSLRKEQKKTHFVTEDPPPMQWGWFYYPRMTYLWREYAETLHCQTLSDPTAATPQVHYRATMPAEAIFSIQALVDVPMRVEFFRHLPGILTGAGIVSTFAGILLGLSEFNPAVEAQQVTAQLTKLFTGITTAFVASFFSILAAILVTILEKFLLHWRYAQVTDLQHRIDDIFRAGVEPDYLADLVNDGKAGFQQLQAVMERLAISITEHMQHPPQAMVDHTVLPKELSPSPLLDRQKEIVQSQFNDPQQEMTHNLKGAVREALWEPLFEISQLLHRTVESQGRRRDDGRSLEIRLVGVGERLDVAMGEFAHAIADIKKEVDGSQETIKSILNRQLGLMEKMDTRMEEVSRHLRSAPAEPLVGENAASLMRHTVEAQTAAIHAWNDSIRKLSAKLPSEDVVSQRIKDTLKVQGQAFQQWTRSLDGLFQKLPSREEFIRLLQEERQHQTDALHGLQHTLEKAIESFSPREDMAPLLRDIQASQASLVTLAQQSPKETLWTELLQELRSSQSMDFQELKVVLQKLPEQFTVWADSQNQGLQELRRGQSSDFQELKAVFQKLPEQFMAWADSQNQGLRAGILDSFAQRLQETSNRMAKQFSQLESQILRERAGVAETLRGLMNNLNHVVKINETQTQFLEGQASEEETMGRVSQAVQKATHSAGEQIVAKVVEQVLSAKEDEKQGMSLALAAMMARMEVELEQLQGQFQENSVQLAERLAGRSQKLEAQSEMDSGLRLQGLADHLAEELKATLSQLAAKQKEQLEEQSALLEKRLAHDSTQLTGQVKASLGQGLTDSAQKVYEQMMALEKHRASSSQEVAEKISDVIFLRLEQTFGTLTKSLTEMRERFSSERNTIVSTMEDWMEDASRSDQEKSQKIDQKISEVIIHVNDHHNDLIGVIDVLNQSLSHDLNGMREKLLSKNEESADHVVRKVTDLGRVLEGVVNSVGQEQTAFIEMLGERMETLRRRLKIK